MRVSGSCFLRPRYYFPVTTAQEPAPSTADRLLSKSRESFVLAVELYNRPTLGNHAEACVIFLCNAWELMLKAHLVKTGGNRAIYYPGDSGRTLALEDCLRNVFTNDKDPLRRNMDEIIRFRNTATHFVVDEYDMIYGPLLQACVSNFADKLEELHAESVADLIPENHLALVVNRTLFEPEQVRTKYEPEVAERLLTLWEETRNNAGDDGNMRYAFTYDTNLRLVNKAKEADLSVFVDKEAGTGIAIVKDLKDPKTKYPFRMNQAVAEVNRRLRKKQAQVMLNGEVKPEFNRAHWGYFVKVFDFKNDPRFGYDSHTETDGNPWYSYSGQAVELVVSQLLKDPEKGLDIIKHQATGK